MRHPVAQYKPWVGGVHCGHPRSWVGACRHLTPQPLPVACQPLRPRGAVRARLVLRAHGPQLLAGLVPLRLLLDHPRRGPQLRQQRRVALGQLQQHGQVLGGDARPALSRQHLRLGAVGYQCVLRVARGRRVSGGVHGEASQGPERGREVGSRLVHQLEEVSHQPLIALLLLGQTQLGAHEPRVRAAVLLVIHRQLGLGDALWQCPFDRLGELGAVPAADVRLRLVGVAPSIVGTVAHVVGVVRVQEPEGPVVNGHPYDAHVVCVEHTVAPAHRLPRSHEARGAAHHLPEPRPVQRVPRVLVARAVRRSQRVAPVLSPQVRVVGADGVVQHGGQHLRLPPHAGARAACLTVGGLEDLKGPKAQKGGRDARDDGGALTDGVAVVQRVAHDARV
mmetsp:Transcript_37664/g.95188  ORF Transcript_37664/g.95188 Transcript_37664/m.95188 type:complete len:392 (-) Transcript_37664:697-1872(-)